MITSLVTGGAGFIGSNLCNRLIDLGHTVICVDNLKTGHIKNIKHLMELSQFKFIELDINIDDIVVNLRIYGI